MAILSILLTVIIIAVSILMVLVVLIQRPKQEGLGAAFGGGTLDSALGAHTTDVLQKFTTWLGILFFVSAIGLAMVKTREFRDSAATDVLEGVEAKKPELPGLPPELSNLPGLGESAPATTPVDSLLLDDVKTAPAAPAPAAVPATPAPAPAAETKPVEAPAPVEVKPAAPAPAAPAAPAPAPAPEGKAKE